MTLIFRCIGGYLDSFISGLDTIYLANTTEALCIDNTVWRENSYATNIMCLSSGPLVQLIKLSLAETTKTEFKIRGTTAHLMAIDIE